MGGAKSKGVNKLMLVKGVMPTYELRTCDRCKEKFEIIKNRTRAHCHTCLREVQKEAQFERWRKVREAKGLLKAEKALAKARKNMANPQFIEEYKAKTEGPDVFPYGTPPDEHERGCHDCLNFTEDDKCLQDIMFPGASEECKKSPDWCWWTWEYHTEYAKWLQEKEGVGH